MPMSPRIKAKKGRFGVGGIVPSAPSMITPVDGTSVTTAVAFAVTAFSYDDIDGDISASITWTSDLDGLVGTGASIMITLTTLGAHVLTLESTATTGGATASSTINYTVVA